MEVEGREDPDSLNSTSLQENPDLGKFYRTNDLVFFTQKQQGLEGRYFRLKEIVKPYS